MTNPTNPKKNETDAQLAAMDPAAKRVLRLFLIASAVAAPPTSGWDAGMESPELKALVQTGALALLDALREAGGDHAEERRIAQNMMEGLGRVILDGAAPSQFRTVKLTSEQMKQVLSGDTRALEEIVAQVAREMEAADEDEDEDEHDCSTCPHDGQCDAQDDPRRHHEANVADCMQAWRRKSPDEVWRIVESTEAGWKQMAARTIDTDDAAQSSNKILVAVDAAKKLAAVGHFDDAFCARVVSRLEHVRSEIDAALSRAFCGHAGDA